MSMKAFWRGFCSVFNFFPSPENPALRTPDFLRRSASEALADDWRKIGADMWRAIERAEQSEESKNASDHPTSSSAS